MLEFLSYTCKLGFVVLLQKKEAEQEKEMQAMMEQVERLKTMEVEYEKQLKEKKAENIVLNVYKNIHVFGICLILNLLLHVTL